MQKQRLWQVTGTHTPSTPGSGRGWTIKVRAADYFDAVRIGWTMRRIRSITNVVLIDEDGDDKAEREAATPGPKPNARAAESSTGYGQETFAAVY
jgi:hypothetical protein